MTYLEKLFDSMEFISKRHESADWADLGPKYDFHAKLTFVKDQPKDRESGGQNDYEWILYSMEGSGSMELRLDLDSLSRDLNLPKPEIIRGFPDVLKGPGVIWRIPEEWNNEYRNKEYVQEEYEFPIPFWRCTDEFFKKRIEHFNRVVNNAYKLSKNKSE